MSERGFIAVDRDVFDHPIFAPEPFTEREAWLWLIAEAAWSEHRVRVGNAVVQLSRGQLAHSLRFMAGKWKWSEARVRRFLARLKNDAMIDAAATHNATQITICNFDKFQMRRRTDEAESDAPNDAAATQNNTREEYNYTGHDAREALPEPERPQRPESEAPACPKPAIAEPISEPDYDTLGRELVKAGGKALVNPATAPGLLVLSDPMNWIRNGCDLQADILPAIRARCTRARPSSIRSWNYFTEAVYQARDNRLKPAPEPNNVQPSRTSRPAAASPHDNLFAALTGRAGAHLAARGGGEPDPDTEPGAYDGRTIDLVAIGR